MATFNVTTPVATAFTVTGDDTLTVTATGSISRAGPVITWSLATAKAAAGVVVTNSGSIASTSGRVFDTSGSASGLVAFSLTNNAGASITAASDLMRIQNPMSGGIVSFDNYGTMTANAGRGVNLQQYAGLASFTFTNRLGASLQSTDDGLRLTTPAAATFTGTILVDNYGSMKTVAVGGGQVIDFNDVNPSAAGHITIVNRATGVIEAADADAIRPGAYGEVQNYGQITAKSAILGDSKDGVDFQSNVGGVVKNFLGGTITAARHGITGDAPVTITNGGTIEGKLGSGVNLDTGSATTSVIGNTGAITGNAAGTVDGDAIDVDGLIDLDNSGTIEAKGTGTGGLTEALAIGGGTVDNLVGGQILSDQRAITVDDSNLGAAFAAVAINNLGLIRGSNGEAIKVTGTFADTLTNKGTILGTVELGGGADTASFYGGSALAGQLDGGDGTDVLNLNGPGSATLGDVINVETINVFGGLWTVSGDLGAARVDFQAGAQILTLRSFAIAGFENVIGGFALGDVIDLEGVGLMTEVFGFPGNLLILHGGQIGPISLAFDPLQSFAGLGFLLKDDGDGGTKVNLATEIVGTNGNNTLNGTSGDNILYGLDGRDTLNGCDGDDLIVGGKGRDTINGGSGSDTVSYFDFDQGVIVNLAKGVGDEGDSDDKLVSIEHAIGSALDDDLIGSDGANSLIGAGGDDELTGGKGGDILVGGTGMDSFIYTSAADFGAPGAWDRIEDFSHEDGDLIELSKVDANTVKSGGQDFIWLGTGAFTGHAGELRYGLDAVGAVVTGDLNGDGVADFSLFLSGVSSLVAADFEL